MVTYNFALFVLLLLAWGMRALMGSLGGEPVTTDYFIFKRDAGPVLFCMAIMTPFMVWDLISLTNRIAGPLYRFESLMKDFVKSGTLKQANLRDGDLLTGFQKQFNEFVEALHALHPETIPTATPAAMAQTTMAPEQSEANRLDCSQSPPSASGSVDLVASSAAGR
jgi:hypothetical protein